MAKKETTSSNKKPATTSKAPAAKKPETSKPAPAANTKAPAATTKAPAPAMGGFDTRSAANAAAAFVGNMTRNQPASGGAKKESGAFKQLKQQANKPKPSALGGILDPMQTNKKSNVPSHLNNQRLGRDQTKGADVTRAGVPRRTAG